MIDTCGCCKGIATITPEPIDNRPGLQALRYRVGTHASFLESMIAALTLRGDPALDDFTTRSTGDGTIALLDAWATVADVLTFYEERIANEGYLRTATERRSVLELARLIGYELRPGVAASAYLAYSLEQGYEIEIPSGTRAQSLPGAGELPQSFETSAPLKARDALNNLEPRKTRPMVVVPPGSGNLRGGRKDARSLNELHLKGAAANLKPNDRILLVFNPADPYPRIVMSADPDVAANRTRVVLVPEEEVATHAAPDLRTDDTRRLDWNTSADAIVGALQKSPAHRPLSPAHLDRHVKEAFAANADAGPALFAAANPLLRDAYYRAWENAAAAPPPELKSVDALRVKAAPFGHNAPPKPIVNEKGLVEGTEEWPLSQTMTVTVRWLRAILTATSDGPASGPVQVSVQRGGERAAAVLPSSIGQHDAAADGFAVHLTAREGSVEIVVKPDQRDRFGLVTERRFVVSSRRDGNTLVIGLSVDAGTTTDDREVRAGQSVGYTVGNRRMHLELSDEGVTISENSNAPLSKEERSTTLLALDATYDQIIAGSRLLVERLSADGLRKESLVFTVKDTATLTKTGYGLTAKVTQVTLDKPLLGDDAGEKWLATYDNTLAAFRSTTVYAQNDPQQLAEEPVPDDVAHAEIELQRLHHGLESGRWLIVSGERTDIPAVSGVTASELVMLSRIEQDMDREDRQPLPGSHTRSTLVLADPLAYTYKRETVKIYGNVVKATHGETRAEVLGSGDGSKAFQQFTLKQPPLTYVASTTPSGVESTLEVRVNEVKWHQVSNLVDAGPRDRCYVVQTDEAGRTTVVFGDGVHGARLPTGMQNVTATYRNGIGQPGNVKAGQITLLTIKPLGVKEVVNPLPASGGADAEDRNEARRNAPLALLALDRLVSIDDYEGFARAFAGIAKASAVRMPYGGHEVVHLTIAGRDDIPVNEDSDLFRHLNLALREFGDPQQPFVVQPRTLFFLVISATVGLAPDYRWFDVERRLRTALLDAFAFRNRELGQDAFLSEALSVMHGVPGVAYVDIDTFASVPENTPQDVLRDLGNTLGRNERVVVDLARPGPATPSPAGLAILTPDVPETLILRGPEQ